MTFNFYHRRFGNRPFWYFSTRQSWRMRYSIGIIAIGPWGFTWRWIGKLVQE